MFAMDEIGIRRMMRLMELPDPVLGNGWLNTTCPLAPWRHGGGVDTRPSFGVSVNSEGPSFFCCFGCMSEAKPLHGLLQAFFVLSGQYPRELARLYLREEIFAESDHIKILKLWEGEGSFKPMSSLPKVVMKDYPLMRGRSDAVARRLRVWMIEERGIPAIVQYRFRLRYDYDRASVVFPLIDHNGKIFVLRERKCRTKNIWTLSPKLAGVPELEFPKLRNVGAWFGLAYIDWRRSVMLVEGEFDVMRIYSLGFTNVIGSATSNVTDAQVAALKGDSYILGYDEDEAGRRAHKRITKLIGRKGTIRTARWKVVDKGDGGSLENEAELQRVLENLE